MELYSSTSYELSKLLTERYSTSFSLSSSLLSKEIQPHIYAIYGMVRVADEIVDTYRGANVLAELDAFEQEVRRAVDTGYSTNPIVHAYAQTAQKYAIGSDLSAPFFASMRRDIDPTPLTQEEYETYIYGSAEVVGLMCLRVFVGGNDSTYERLKPGARALGSAYQKVNFLRDLAADSKDLGRSYFPAVSTIDDFAEETKQALVSEIRSEFTTAYESLQELPSGAQRAVKLSYDYYQGLLSRIESASVQQLKTQRMSVPTTEKLLLYLKARYL